MPLTMSRTLRRTMLSALAVIGLSMTVAISMPPETAHAQSGYRVCGAWNSAESPGPDSDYWTPGHGIGTGLAVKVWMRGGQTCANKLGWMKTYYTVAYPKSSPENSFSMVTCERFAQAIGLGRKDPCPDLTVNKIYTYTSSFDALHPVANPAFRFFAN
jgi:hypothetical protein